MAQEGIRFAARRITLVCSTIWDFAPGVPPSNTHPIRDIIRLAHATDSTIGSAALADMIQQMMTATATTTWQQAQALLGLTKRAIRAVNPDGTPLPIKEVEIPPLDWRTVNDQPGTLTDVELSEPDPIAFTGVGLASILASPPVGGVAAPSPRRMGDRDPV
jgi:hypothetical protein